jgi:hypothetical protein
MLGLAALGSAVFFLRVAPWAYGEIRDLRQRFETKTELLARTRADIRSAAQLVDSGTALKKGILALAPKILAGAGESEALADLAGRLALIAERHRVRLDRTERLPDSTRAGRLRRVALRAHIESDSRGTLEMLAAVGRGPTVLALRDLRIMAIDPDSPDRVAELLRTELTVEGWFLQRDSAP